MPHVIFFCNKILKIQIKYLLQNVYEPSEDTFLLLDALELDLPELSHKKPLICVEIGPGSGIVISAVAKHLNQSSAHFAIDINPHACRVTKRTSQVNHVNIDVLNMDLLTCFKKNSIDLLIFNPPYVPTYSSNQNVPEKHKFYDVDAEAIYQKTDDEKMLIKSWAGGGDDGCEVMNRILHNLNNILAPNGVFYLLVIKDNNPEKIKGNLREIGCRGMEIIDRKIRGEHLIVLKIEKIVE